MEIKQPERRFWITVQLGGHSDKPDCAVNVQVEITRDDAETRQALKAAGFRWVPDAQEWHRLCTARNPQEVNYLRMIYHSLFAHGFRLAVPYATPVIAVRHLTWLGFDWRELPIEYHGGYPAAWHLISPTLVESQIAESRNWPALGSALVPA